MKYKPDQDILVFHKGWWKDGWIVGEGENGYVVCIESHYGDDRIDVSESRIKESTK